MQALGVELSSSASESPMRVQHRVSFFVNGE